MLRCRSAATTASRPTPEIKIDSRTDREAASLAATPAAEQAIRVAGAIALQRRGLNVAPEDLLEALALSAPDGLAGRELAAAGFTLDSRDDLVELAHSAGERDDLHLSRNRRRRLSIEPSDRLRK